MKKNSLNWTLTIPKIERIFLVLRPTPHKNFTQINLQYFE